MIVFLIILAVVVIIVSAILSLSATFTITYENNWHTTVKVLWFEKEIELTEILSFLLFPDKKAEEQKAKKADKNAKEKADSGNDESSQEKTANGKDKKNEKPNYIKKIWDEEGIVGIMSFISNLIESASSAISTLFRDFHIYSLYVKILVGGSDAASIAQSYGRICAYYYPLKGAVLNGMTVDNYDDWVEPDFIAPRSEYGLQFIGSISILTIIKVLLSAGKTYLTNLKNK